MKRIAIAIAILLGSLGSASAQTNCMVPSAFPATAVVSPSAESGRVLKASPGCLLAVYVTTGAVAGYITTYNSITVPADGASQTPINCVAVAANSSVGLNFAPQPPEFYSTGIAVAFSSTGCFTKTASATAFFHALVQ
jgi:hypothetical protein